MTDEQLQAWVEEISLRSFGLPFRHEARFNRRLRSTGGRYFMKSHHIEINPAQLAAYGVEEVEKIIKHELCHYHLHIMGRGYRHRDPEFKALLNRVGEADTVNRCLETRAEEHCLIGICSSVQAAVWNICANAALILGDTAAVNAREAFICRVMGSRIEVN